MLSQGMNKLVLGVDFLGDLGKSNEILVRKLGLQVPQKRSFNNCGEIMSVAVAGNKVKVRYTGTFDDGATFDSSEGHDPLEFEVGGGQVIPGFDKAVLGMKVGESKKVRIPEADAYGVHNPEMVIESDLGQFEEGLNPEVGQQFQTEMEDGQPVILTVVEVEGEKVVLDANHPMAGKDLNFEIELVEIV